MDRKKWILVAIIALAATIRLYKLGSVPPHLTPDEASLGYNAYSILKTGKDEYGRFLPVIFKSFGDYKPGLYIYLSAPFIATLGLTEFAVRLPSALSGIIAVWLIYKISSHLFSEKKKDLFGLAAAFLLAISPWHIHFSRGAWEANVSLTLTLAAIYFFLKACSPLQKALSNNKYLVYSVVFFALTMVTYQGAKLSTVIVATILAAVYWKKLRNISKRSVTIALIVAVVITLPVVFSFFQGRTGRLSVFSVFSYARPTDYLQTFLDQGNEKIGSITYSLFHPEGLNFTRGIVGRWFNHFSTRFLFFQGDWQNPRHSAPNHGVLILADIILLVTGFVFLVRKNTKASVFIFLWLALSPLPAVLSRDQVHAVRALNMVIPLTLLSGSGAMSLVEKINKVKYRVVLGGFLVIVYIVNYIYFLDAYFVHLPTHNARHWFYGYKQAVEEVASIKGYNRIVFQQSYDQPYIYFLFYGQIDPAKHQEQTVLSESEVGDVGVVEKLGNVEFRWMSWPVANIQPGDLLVANSVAVPAEFVEDNFIVIKEIKYPDNLGTAFRVMKTK